jgi:hypothetical protein
VNSQNKNTPRCPMHLQTSVFNCWSNVAFGLIILSLSMQAGFITCWDTWWGTHQPWRVCWFQSSSIESFAPEELQFWHCVSCKETTTLFVNWKLGMGAAGFCDFHGCELYHTFCADCYHVWPFCYWPILLVSFLSVVSWVASFSYWLCWGLSHSLFCHFTDMDVGSEISITLSLGHLWTLFRLSLTDCTYGENKFSMLYKEMMWFFVFLCWCWRERALFACLLSVFNLSKNFWYLMLAIGSFLLCLYRSLLCLTTRSSKRCPLQLLWLLVHCFFYF